MTSKLKERDLHGEEPGECPVQLFWLFGFLLYLTDLGALIVYGRVLFLMLNQRCEQC